MIYFKKQVCSYVFPKKLHKIVNGLMLKKYVAISSKWCLDARKTYFKIYPNGVHVLLKLFCTLQLRTYRKGFESKEWLEIIKITKMFLAFEKLNALP